MSLDTLLKKTNEFYHNPEIRADTLGKVTYSLAVGIPLDYYASGLRGFGIAASRGSATAINLGTGTLYAKWRRGWYDFTNTNENSNKLRKSIVELGAFNTFETYVYGIGAVVGATASYLITGKEINPVKICEGMEKMVYLSPLIGPTMGAWLNLTCKLFGVKTVTERTINSE